MRKASTLEEFIKDLTEDTLARIEYVAMVKMDEENNNGLLIAVGSDCERWISLPAAIVDNIEYLRTAPCKDHTHEVVRLTLKMPKKDNPVALLFAELFLQQQDAGRLLPMTSEPLQLGLCRPMKLGGCELQPDGTYAQEFQTADCETVLRPCNPPRPPQPSIDVRGPGGPFGGDVFSVTGKRFSGNSTVTIFYQFSPYDRKPRSPFDVPNFGLAGADTDPFGNFSTTFYKRTTGAGVFAVQATDENGLSAATSFDTTYPFPFP